MSKLLNLDAVKYSSIPEFFGSDFRNKLFLNFGSIDLSVDLARRILVSNMETYLNKFMYYNSFDYLNSPKIFRLLELSRLSFAKEVFWGSKLPLYSVFFSKFYSTYFIPSLVIKNNFTKFEYDREVLRLLILEKLLKNI